MTNWIERLLFQRVHAALLITLFCAATSSLRADDARTELREALDRLNEGIQLRESNDPSSDAVIGEAAAMLETVADSQNPHTPEIYLALGNAYALTGDTAHALISYRRGEQLDPQDERLRDSLASQRSKVGVKVEPDRTHRVTQLLMSWRGVVPRQLLFYLFLLGFLLSWALLTLRILDRLPKRASALSFWILGFSMIPILMLIGERLIMLNPDEGVIMQQGILARSGPDDSVYDPVFTEPLAPGIEAHFVNSRNGWYQVQLADGTKCWIPAESFEFVRHRGRTQS